MFSPPIDSGSKNINKNRLKETKTLYLLRGSFFQEKFTFPFVDRDWNKV